MISPVLAQVAAMTEATTIPLTWALAGAATIIGALGGIGLLVFRWWVGGLERQNAALTDELKEMNGLLAEMREEMREQKTRIEYLTNEVERLREREAA